MGQITERIWEIRFQLQRRRVALNRLGNVAGVLENILSLISVIVYKRNSNAVFSKSIKEFLKHHFFPRKTPLSFRLEFFRINSNQMFIEKLSYLVDAGQVAMCVGKGGIDLNCPQTYPNQRNSNENSKVLYHLSGYIFENDENVG